MLRVHTPRQAVRGGVLGRGGWEAHVLGSTQPSVCPPLSGEVTLARADCQGRFPRLRGKGRLPPNKMRRPGTGRDSMGQVCARPGQGPNGVKQTSAHVCSSPALCLSREGCAQQGPGTASALNKYLLAGWLAGWTDVWLEGGVDGQKGRYMDG